MRYGSRPSDQFVDKRPRRSNQHCPKCGTRMLKRVTFDECPGCKATVAHPVSKRSPDNQPVDNLAAKLRRAVQPRGVSEDYDFQRTVVPPEMANEHHWLDATGCTGIAFLVLAWGVLLTLQEVTGVSIWFKFCWGAFLVSAFVNTAAMLHNNRMLRQVGLAWALVMIPISIAAWFLVPPSAVQYLMENNTRLDTRLVNQILIHGHLAAAVYYAWLAWFSWREMNMR